MERSCETNKGSRNMESLDKKLARIGDTAERFPLQMLMIREVFTFSFAEASRISNKFQTQSDCIEAILLLRNYIGDSDIDDETKARVDALLREEIDVISFSQTSRCSVISL
jgi:hypothetical protein